MIDVARLGLALAGSVFAASCERLPVVGLSRADTSARLPVIGWLSRSNARRVPKDAFQWGFFRRLRELGFEDDESVIFDSYVVDVGRNRDDSSEIVAQIATLASEVVRQQPDVIVTDIGARELKVETQTIPVVFILGYDPLEAGLVSDLTRPGGNLTGVYSATPPSIHAKRLELLKEAFPHIERVAVLVAPASVAPNLGQSPRPPHAGWDELDAAARTLGIALQLYPVTTPEERDEALAAMARDGMQGVVQVGLLVGGYQPIIAFQRRTRLPVMYAYRNDAGPISYAPDPNVLYARAADYVAAILRGARPADLPMERITVYELAVNPRFADFLGLTISQSVLARTTRVGLE